MAILVFNAGSSSLKCSLYDSDSLATAPTTTPLWQAQVDWRDTPDGTTLTITEPQGQSHQTLPPGTTPVSVLTQVIPGLWSGVARVIDGPQQITLIGQRIVHGGALFHDPTPITPVVRADFAQLIPLAPEHMPVSLSVIDIVAHLLDGVTQIAIFDTAFHQTLPLAAAVYPLPYALYEQGVRRYGFHGISHQYAAQRAAQLLGRDSATLSLITCHLGNGCSLAAIHHGVSIDTTMGFTPLEGVMMGTRSGSVDPGLLLYLLQQGQTTAQLDHMLNHAAGLLGVSGISGDMRDILQAKADGNARAQLAFDIYIHRLRGGIGAMLASLGRLDALVFTGGVGEHAAQVRQGACDALGFLGLALDEHRNAAVNADSDIATAASPVRALVVHAQENWAIARDCWQWARQQA
jgi:acetate kinase